VRYEGMRNDILIGFLKKMGVEIWITMPLPGNAV
jgi:hypothetical protein